MSEKTKSESVNSAGKKVFSSGLHKIPRIWALVADLHAARIFSKRGDTISLVSEIIPQSKNETAFAHEIAAWLDAEVGKDSFDRLVLIAPPPMLGELRKTISQNVYARIVAEVNRDFTKMSEADLHTELGKILWF